MDISCLTAGKLLFGMAHKLETTKRQYSCQGYIVVWSFSDLLSRGIDTACSR